MAPLPAQAEEDIELAQVLADFGTLPAIVTPVRDPQGELVVTPAEYRVPDVPGSLFVVPAWPTVMSPSFPQPSTGSVGCSSVPPTIPAVSTPEESLLLQAPEMSQGQPWVGPSSRGESAGSHLPAAPLTPRPATASYHDSESDAVWGRLDVPDLSREGPFDIHQDHPHSGASPQLHTMWRMVDQILRRHMVSSSMIHACWSMSALRNRHGYSVVAQSTGSITWEGRRPSRPRNSCSTMLG